MELVMEPAVQALADQFRVVTNAYLKALDGMDHDALLTRPGVRSNPAIWVAGHLVQSRARLINVLGGARELPWPDLFRTGSTIVDPSAYPDAAAIVAQWRELTDDLMRRLESLGPAELARDAPRESRVPTGHCAAHSPSSPFTRGITSDSSASCANGSAIARCSTDDGARQPGLHPPLRPRR